jgi:REP element-mobilizing transposase RayT
MSRNYKFHNPNGIYFVSFSIVYWISVFTREIYFDILINHLKFYQKERGLILYAYCIMPNHIHLIFRSELGKPAELLRDYKKITTRSTIKGINENPKESRKEWMLWMFQQAAKRDTRKSVHKFWQYHSNPIELWSNRVIDQKLDYIHNNPVVAGFVNKPFEWKYSSAQNYMLSDDTLIQVTRLK